LRQASSISQQCGEECESDASSYVIALDYQNGGGSEDDAIFDINEDGSYTTEDTYVVDASGVKHQVVGLALGEGIISSLTISSTGNGTTIYASLAGGDSSSSSGSGDSSGSSSGTSSASTDSDVSTGTNISGSKTTTSVNPDLNKAQLKGWWQTTN